MINQLVAQFVDQYIREFLGDWDPAVNLKIDSLTEPEVNLTNVPLPQYVFDMAEIPFVIDYSNIGRINAKFSWGTFLGENLTHKKSNTKRNIFFCAFDFLLNTVIISIFSQEHLTTHY